MRSTKEQDLKNTCLRVLAIVKNIKNCDHVFSERVKKRTVFCYQNASDFRHFRRLPAYIR